MGLLPVQVQDCRSGRHFRQSRSSGAVRDPLALLPAGVPPQPAVRARAGNGYVAGVEALSDLWRTTPHNEYLHFRVEGGVVGFGLCLAAIGLWYRQLLRGVATNDRLFLLALAPAVLIYAFTVDLLIYWAGLALYAYLGMLPTRVRVTAPLLAMRRRTEGRHPADAQPPIAPPAMESGSGPGPSR